MQAAIATGKNDLTIVLGKSKKWYVHHPICNSEWRTLRPNLVK